MTEQQGGHIYILFNQVYSYYGSNIYKVGKAKDVALRVNNYTTSYLHSSEIKYISPFVKDYTLAEKYIFEHMRHNRLKPRREFFEIKNMEEIINLIENVIQDINNDVITCLLIQAEDNDIKDEEELYDIDVELYEDFLEDEDRNKEEYSQIQHNLKFLNLQTDEQLKTYQDIIINKDKIEEHKNIIILLKNNETDYYKKMTKTTLNKIKLIREIEETYDISLSNLSDRCEQVEMNDNMFNAIKLAFHVTKPKPRHFNELLKLYVGLVRHFGCYSLITSVRLRTKLHRDKTVYSLTDNIIDYHIKLHSIREAE